MDEKYLSSLMSKYMDLGKSSSLDWLYRPVDDRDANIDGGLNFDTFIIDYPDRILQGQDLDRGATRDRIDALAASLAGFKKKALDTIPLHKKPDLTLAETIELFKKGYRVYSYSEREMKMVEITIENEEDFVGCVKEFLLPMMADKINERYEEIGRLEVELHQQTVKIKNEITELHERIKEIKNNGTDLII